MAERAGDRSDRPPWTAGGSVARRTIPRRAASTLPMLTAPADFAITLPQTHHSVKGVMSRPDLSPRLATADYDSVLATRMGVATIVAVLNIL